MIIIRIRCRSSVTITCGYSESYCKLHQILRLISAINISGDVLRFLSLLYCDIFCYFSKELVSSGDEETEEATEETKDDSQTESSSG